MLPSTRLVAFALVVAVACRAAADEAPPLATVGPEPHAIEPLPEGEIRGAVDRGVDFLLGSQLENGAWGSIESPRYYRVYAPLPAAHHAFRTAVTSLAISALLEARPHARGERVGRIETAVRRGLDWLLENSGDLRRAAPDDLAGTHGYTLYNVWGHGYALSALAALYESDMVDEPTRQRIVELARVHADRLARDSLLNGGWGYLDSVGRTQRPAGSPTCFTTATCLIGLKDAERLGVTVPEKIIDAALASIRRQRLPDFSYAYGEYVRLQPRRGINRPAGSLGRSQVCNLALRLYGDDAITDDVIRTWLDRFIARNGWLSKGRKTQRPHESHFQIAGYFFYYGHLYASMCVELLPEEERAAYHAQIARLIVPLQETDGSWWDFMLYDYHQQYGTAMAVSTLLRGLPRPDPSTGG